MYSSKRIEMFSSTFLLFLQEYAIERLESYFQLKNKLLNGAAMSGSPEGGVKRKIHELES